MLLKLKKRIASKVMKKQNLVYDAMAYQIAKEIGAAVQFLQEKLMRSF